MKNLVQKISRYVPVIKAFFLAIVFSSAIAAGIAIVASEGDSATAAMCFAIVFATLFSASFIIPTINLLRGRTTYGKGIFAAGLYPEVYTSEMIKRFNQADTATWRAGIPNKSQYCSFTADGESVVINMTYFGVSPDVLVDNTTYPIDVQDLNGENLTLSLKKFQTKATPITDDEIRGLSFDKIRTVQEAHAIKLIEEKNNLAIHSIAPASNTATSPVLLTTGADDGTGRKRLVIADILALKKGFDDAGVPESGRRLVLCNDHINDLLASEQKFADQYYNYVTGKVSNMYGFEIYNYGTMPKYNVTTKAKLSYGGVVTSNHTNASVAFHILRVAQATSGTKAYLSQSSNDPLMQRNLLNYRTYDVVMPIEKGSSIGAIVSGKV